MIKNIDLKGLRNSDFLQFLADLLRIVNFYGAARLGISEEHEVLQRAEQEVVALCRKKKGSSLTGELAVLDSLRDDLINGILSLVHGYTYSPDPKIKQSGHLLQNHLYAYGTGIASENYPSETSILNLLVNEWSTKPDLAKAVEVLNLTSWKKQLAEANDAFHLKYIHHTKEMANLPDDSITERREAATYAYFALRTHITALYTMHHGKEPYPCVVNDINDLIELYTRLISARKAPPSPPEVSY
jgi:hypothetical protein